MTAVLAVDQGTTGSTALVVADDGRIVGRGYREITQHYPEPGQVEHDPEDIFRKTLEAAREALTRFAPGPEASGRQARTAEWQRAVETALHWAAAGRGRRPRR